MTPGDVPLGAVADYESNVFINCPFDSQYLSLLRPLLFTVLYLGYKPRIASERSDSGENRLDKICQLIRESKYSIHDLSRLKAKRAREYYRLNMPFELGIDYGSRQHGHEYLRCKKCLILEKKLHDFRRALSDLGGVDIKNHDDEPIKVVRAVRDWFVETVGQLSADSPVIIWWKYTDFSKYLFDTKIEEGLAETDAWEDIQGMPVPEYINRVNLWLSRPSDAN